MMIIFRAFAFIFCLFALQACSPSEKERMTIAELTKDMTTHCFGRHLIDMPKSFNQLKMDGPSTAFGPKGVDFQKAPKMEIEILEENVSFQQFSQAVEKRLSELKAERPAYEKKRSLFSFVQKISTEEILIRWQEGDAPDGYFFSEIHLYRGKSHGVVNASSYDNGFVATEKWLADFAKTVVAFDPSSTSQKGFCVGPLVLTGSYEREIVLGLAFRSKKQPDVFFTIDTNTFGEGPEQTLLQRVNSPKNLLNVFDISFNTLRKGELKVAGLKAQEVLVSFKGSDDEGKATKEQKLLLETMREKPSPLEPLMTIRMVTGQQDPDGVRHTSSLTDTEVTGVWDAIIKSIRLRPGAV